VVGGDVGSAAGRGRLAWLWSDLIAPIPSSSDTTWLAGWLVGCLFVVCCLLFVVCCVLFVVGLVANGQLYIYIYNYINVYYYNHMFDSVPR